MIRNNNTEIGRRAEQRVADLLVARGCILLGTNVRVGRDELDVVAVDGSVLIVVEVRARRRGSAAHPLETIDARKADRIRRAAMRYMAAHGAEELRIDVAAVSGDAIELIENAIDFTST